MPSPISVTSGDGVARLEWEGEVSTDELRREVAAHFTDYTGPFMIHCHMLDHEDHGMMATFRVVR